MTQSRIIEQHDISSSEIQQASEVIRILKEIYPKSIIKITVYRQLRSQFIESYNLVPTRQQKQNPIKNQSCTKRQQTDKAQKTIQKKVTYIKTQTSEHYQPIHPNDKHKQKIVSGFIEDQIDCQLQLDQISNFTTQTFEGTDKDDFKVQKQPAYKNMQTICRFYGTQRGIYSRKSTKDQNQSSADDNKYQRQSQLQNTLIKYNKTKNTQNVSNDPTITVLKLTEKEELYEGLLAYSETKYPEAIQIFLSILEQFLIDELDYQKVTNIKQVLSTELSIYQSRVLGNLLFHLGNCYFRLQEYKKSLLFYQIDESMLLQNKEQKAQRYNNMGSCYVKMGKQHMSLKCYEKSLKLYYHFPQVDKSNLIYNIANIYLNFGMYKEANQYFKISIEERKLKSPQKHQMLSKTYFYLGISQRHEGKLQSSTGSLILGKQIAQTQQVSRNLHEKILYEMAVNYEICKNWQKALNFYEKIVEQIFKKGQNRIQLGQIYQKVSFIFKRLKKTQKYEYFKKKSLQEYRNKFKKEHVNNQNNIQDKLCIKKQRNQRKCQVIRTEQ